MDNNKKLLPRANSNIEFSEEERQTIVKNAAKAYESYLDALCIDWRNDPNSKDTPMRVAKAYVYELATGCYSKHPKITAFKNEGEYSGIVFQGGIPVKSLCSHHAMPFIGKAHVAYIPSEKGMIIGLSKLNRIVEFYSRRPSVQESLTNSIHQAIDDVCKDNIGVAVMISATHTCACLRGVNHDGCEMKTSKLSKAFMDKPAARAEFYEFVRDMKSS